MKLYKFLIPIFGTLALTSCGEDFLNELPTDVATSEQIQKAAEKDAEAVLAPQLNGIYTNWNFRAAIASNDINSHISRGMGGIMLLSDMMSNDISLVRNSVWLYDHTLDYTGESYVRARWPWLFFYTVIKNSNELISVVDDNTTSAKAKAAKAQALAFRGISYAYLAAFYQKAYTDPAVDPTKALAVPVLLASNEEGSIQSRATLARVYEQAENDLLRAINLFGDFTRTDATQINAQVAQGLLSRVYLAMGRWDDAAKMANAARQGYKLMDAEETADFNYQSLNNPEVMWGLKSTKETTLMFASFQSWRSADDVGYAGQVGLFQLIDAALYKNLGDDDARKELFVAPGTTAKATVGGTSWTIPAYGNRKFKRVAEWLGDVIYLRASEMYLTEAEALAHAGRSAEALAVMKEFMAQRDPSWNASAVTVDDIYTQRRLELWGEGFGFFDCKRLQKDLVRKYEGSNELQSLQVNIPYNDQRWVYQLPLSEIQNNNEISEDDQNPYGGE